MKPPPKSVLPADERIWPLKPEVLLARGKGELQAKEEKAIHGAVKEAIATYQKETVALVENNMEDRKRVAELLVQSAEEAEEILIRQCTHDQAKNLKYRGKDAQDVSENIDEEIALLNNVLNDFSNKRKQRTKVLLDQQRMLATMQVNLEYGVDTFPEEEQRCRQLECHVEKVEQKMAAAVTFRNKYHQFVDKLNVQKKHYGARLDKLQTCIKQDIYDLEVCHDIMMKGHILSQDAAINLEDTTTTLITEKKERDFDIKSIRREVLRKADQTNRKKGTITDVDLDKVLKGHQTIFAQIQERRKTMVELDNWAFDFEALQAVTRGTDIATVVTQFENLAERQTYLNNERERVEAQRLHQMDLLRDQQTMLSSVSHTGDEANLALDNRRNELESMLRVQHARRGAAEERLHTLGTSLTSSRSTLRQLLRAVKFVSRPQGWQRKEGQSELAGDLELLRFKIISVQQRYEALGAPLRLDSQASIRSDMLDGPNGQFRIGKLARDSLLAVEMGKVDDMQPIRTEMKHMSEEFVNKMSKRASRPP